MKAWLKRGSLWLGLILALVHGLLYVFLMPPWQHYDEPNHFERAWLTANRAQANRQPDAEMRRQVASSMIEHGFFDGMGFLPDLYPQTGMAWIGAFDQLDEPPLYYLLTAAPLRLLSGQGVEVQLYAARFVSLALFLVTVAAAWGAVGTLAGFGHPLQWMVTLTLALWPAAADLMTAVNNDVAAVAVFSLFLWGCLRLLKHGANLLDLLWVIGTAGLCLLAKEMVYVAPLLGALAILLAVLRQGAARKIAWVLIALALLGGLAGTLDWGDAALWYRQTDQAAATRQHSEAAPLGKHAFRLDCSLAASPQEVRLYQALPGSVTAEQRGQVITLGAWMWASRPLGDAAPDAAMWTSPPLEGVTLMLHVSTSQGGVSQVAQTFAVSETPQFFSFTEQFPENALSAWVTATPAAVDVPVIVYLDGFVLASGGWVSGTAPQWQDAQSERGTWDGQPFTNWLRNASAEQAGLSVRPWVDRLGMRLLPDQGRPSLILYTLADWEAEGWYYRAALHNLLQTFWGKFGWAHVPLLGDKPYRLLGALTLVGVLGCLLAPWRELRRWPWAAMLLLGATLAALWGMALARGAVYVFYRPFIPVARYAFPALIPSLLVLCLGWWQIARRMRRWLRLPEKMVAVWPGLAYLVLLLALDLYAIVSIWAYYSS